MQEGKKMALPKRIISIPNPDKGFMEDWTAGRDMLNLPHSYRLLALGPPNVGKSTVVKNIIVRAKPKFKKIYLLHCDPEGTIEYDDLNVEVLDDVPEPYSELFKRDTKSMLIMDDCEFSYMSKDQKRRLDRLFGYTSTHKSLSICVCAQDMFNLLPCIRRMSNVIILWKVADLDLLRTIGRRVGYRKDEFARLCSENWLDIHDSIWIDLTKNSPYPLRVNGYHSLSN